MATIRRITILSSLLLLYFYGNAQFTAASWKGNLQINGITVPLIFHIHSKGQGLGASMESPSQSTTAFPIDSVWTNGDSIFMLHTQLNIFYKGKYVELTDSIVGIFTQNGFDLPLHLGTYNSDEAGSLPVRPQTPSYDVDYNMEEVEIPNNDAHISLVGTLTMPRKKTKPTCIVLVSGSGPQNRDEELLGHKPFWVLADFLTRNGYAVLRYDDRGTAKSKGNYENATMDDLSSDAYAAVQYLQSRQDIGRIGMVGHSEGGGIVQQVAATHPVDIAFIVMLAGPGLRGDSMMLLQKKTMELQMGLSPGIVALNAAFIRPAYDTALQYPQWSHGLPKIKDYFFQAYEQLHPDWTDGKIVAELPKTTQAFTPEFYSILRFDPAQYLPKVTCPLLALNGSKDVQVLPTENLSTIQSLTRQNKNVTAKELPGLNHLFQEADTGLPNEYGTITQTFSPVAMNCILEWLRNGGF
ncbi:MAG: alpha/beta hydrolase [Chitinophagaceae bacterium]